jgi:hypothetical protein
MTNEPDTNSDTNSDTNHEPEPPSDEPSTIDELMARIDEEIAFGSGIVQPKYIDAVIAYQRQQRAKRMSGGRTKKAPSEGPALDVTALLNKPIVKINRRF